MRSCYIASLYFTNALASFFLVQPTLFTTDFSLRDRVALVTGANGGLGLESALAFIEAGARAVYCLDIAPTPSEEWLKVKDYVSRMEGKAGEGRLENISADVSDQVGARFLRVLPRHGTHKSLAARRECGRLVG